jgi:hypothetical protein
LPFLNPTMSRHDSSYFLGLGSTVRTLGDSCHGGSTRRKAHDEKEIVRPFNAGR